MNIPMDTEMDTVNFSTKNGNLEKEGNYIM